MEGHHEKRRDMARSILPSKNREAARKALARAKRANRREIRQELTILAVPRHGGTAVDPETAESWDACGDLRRDATVEVRENVLWRRDGDKLNHFIRWAIATTAELPIGDRLPHLRSIVGGGLIGDHAMSHLARESDLRPPYDHDWRYRRVRASVRASEAKVRLDRNLDVLREVLREVVIAPGGLKYLNRTMKTCDRHTIHQDCVRAGCVKRCLAGHHDIDQFLRDVYGPVARYEPRVGPSRLPARRFAEYLFRLADSVSR